MRKYATRYPVEGTSALRLEPAEPAVGDAAIIAFPGLSRNARAANRGFGGSCPMPPSNGSDPTGRLVLGSELVAGLRAGDAAGKPFGRMKPWQAAVGGFALCATAFAGLFLAL